MKTKLKMKCPACGAWNRFEVEKVMFEPESPEPKVKVFVPMYMPLKIESCQKCGKTMAEPRELIRITKEKTR